MKLVLVLLAAIFLVACESAPPRPVLPEAEPILRRLKRKDPRSGEIVRSWSVLVYADGRQLKHGPDLHWYATGGKLSEGRFEYGEPEGVLRRWYANGQMRSECSFQESSEAMEMKFWHENGQLSARGPALRGQRTGAWVFWWPDGNLREEGQYEAGERAGLWTLRYENGALRSRGRYSGGRRIAPWEHWTLSEPTRP
ncbi:MAG: hypothetical protein ABGY71_00670 [bacterium]|jgi:antitoxin component YwqK of YwqJK toxin-antitoxin module|nr:hypothetical protein [Planctomycetota bacterium]HIL51851.1 hypothetical protein [Planctomycetota bacterium]